MLGNKAQEWGTVGTKVQSEDNGMELMADGVRRSKVPGGEGRREEAINSN